MTIRTAALACTVLCVTVSGAQGTTPLPTEITVSSVVSRLVENNQRRSRMLRAYTSRRTYHLLYTGILGRHEANMVVDVTYAAPDSKDFTIVSQTGSRIIVNRVFKRLLETEKQATDARHQAQTALTPDNYDFELLGKEEVDQRPAYILKVEPKTDNKLLYRGKIWVDAADFAVMKIEAQPARRPSFWISKTTIHHRYGKFGEFWLPVDDESTSDIRLGGDANLSIHYGEYKLTSAAVGSIARNQR
jgi:outer membrane lipoprotein-sorting protein